MKYFTEKSFGSYTMTVNSKTRAEIIEDAIKYYEKYISEEIRKKWLVGLNSNF